MPQRKKGTTKNSDKPATIVQALSNEDWDLLRRAKEKREADAATKGSESWRIAASIWSPQDAALRLQEAAGYTSDLKMAHYRAIIMRTFTLACHPQAPPAVVAEYSNIFYNLGRLKCARKVFHDALMEKLDHSGFRVELDEQINDANRDPRPENIFDTLRSKPLGCENLLHWIWQRQNTSEGSFDDKKFNDYTNLLLRSDAGLTDRPISSIKMRLHRGDFVSYMKKILSGKKPKEILNPLKEEDFTLTGTVGYARAVAQQYDPKDSRTDGQGYFNLNHDYDELDHKLIDRAMKSYVAGSNWFWSFFALCSMQDACQFLATNATEADVRLIIETRARNWVTEGKTFPIRESTIEVITILVLAYLAGLANPEPLTPEEKKTWSDVASRQDSVSMVNLEEADKIMGQGLREAGNRLNCSTPAAIARVEHREPLRHQFYF